MSLRDTIAAARQEAADGGSVFVGRDDDAGVRGARGSGAGTDADAETGRRAKRSAASARPVREAATSVRVVSAADAREGRTTRGRSRTEMTKEERKAERQARRSEEDMRSSAVTILLRRQEQFTRRQRVWWIMLGVGFALTILSFVLTRAFPLTENGGVSPTSIVSIIALVAAYALIIGAFVYDWRRVRPLRRAAEDEVQRYSDKKLRRFLREDAELRERES